MQADSGVSVFWLRAEDFDEEQAGSDDDAGVGYVEVGPVVVDDVDFEEVDDDGVDHAVVEISDGSAEDEGEGYAGDRELAAYAPEQRAYDDDGDDREGDERVADGDGGERVGEERKGRARVEDVREAEDAGDDDDTVAGADVVHDPELRETVEQDDERGDEQEDGAFVAGVLRVCGAGGGH